VRSALQGDPASLSGLADIVELTPVPFWPPAPGWWVVAAVAVAALLAYAIRARVRYRANDYRRSALRELQDVAPDDAAPMRVAELLKRTAIAGMGREAVAGLSGEEWVAWLNSRAGRPLFSDQVARLLAELMYRPGVAPDQAATRELIQAAGAWIRRHRGAA